MTSPSSPLAWKFAEIARFERDGRYNDNFKAIFIKLRMYSATSVVEVALRRLSLPFASLVEELKSFPWLTLLLVKWALRDGNINIRVGRRISDQEFEHLLQLTWDLHDAGYGASPHFSHPHGSAPGGAAFCFTRRRDREGSGSRAANRGQAGEVLRAVRCAEGASGAVRA